MPINFSEHAKFQLKKRKISQKLVIQAVQKPDKVLISYKGRRLRRIKVSDKLLEVVTTTEGSIITIITGYYLKEKL